MTDDPATTVEADTATASIDITASMPDNAVLTITVKPSPESEITSLTKWIAQIECTPQVGPETLEILTEASQEFVDYAWRSFKNSNKTRLFQSRHAARVRKTVKDAEDSEEETIQRTSRELTARLHGEFLDALKNDWTLRWTPDLIRAAYLGAAGSSVGRLSPLIQDVKTE